MKSQEKTEFMNASMHTEIYSNSWQEFWYKDVTHSLKQTWRWFEKLQQQLNKHNYKGTERVQTSNKAQQLYKHI